MNLFSLAFPSSGLMTFSFFHAFEESRAEWLPGRGRRYQAKILQPVLCLMGGKIKKVKEKQPKKSDLWCRDPPQKKKESFCMSQNRVTSQFPELQNSKVHCVGQYYYTFSVGIFLTQFISVSITVNTEHCHFCKKPTSQQYPALTLTAQQ